MHYCQQRLLTGTWLIWQQQSCDVTVSTGSSFVSLQQCHILEPLFFFLFLFKSLPPLKLDCRGNKRHKHNSSLAHYVEKCCRMNGARGRRCLTGTVGEKETNGSGGRRARRWADLVGRKRDGGMEAEVCDRYISLCACLPPVPLAYH